MELQLSPLFGIKRKAIFECLIYNDRSKQVVTQWRVVPVDDSGARIESKMLTEYTKELIADETVMVNPQTGEFVDPDENGNYPEGSTNEYQFYKTIAETQPVIVNDLILLAANRAAAAGRFDI